MTNNAFEEFANDYDQWFLSNPNVLKSELALLAHCLNEPGRSLSIGCGTGLFERLLEKNYNIRVTHGIEPAEAMAEIARQRGLQVRIGTAEESAYGDNEYDTEKRGPWAIRKQL
ncbi:MAG: class I SAM-dependent methyltransferase [Desulfuromonadales bacterium]|nr:class I SAM-dependent methyltransferase [Desulfuromonadales bacterium]